MLKKIIHIGLLFLLFLLVTGVTAYLAVTFFIRNEDTVVVPELVGKNVVQALEILSNSGLNTKVSGSEYSSQIPQNHVIYQDPEPGTIIKKGRDVRIIFSKGAQIVFVPAVAFLDSQAAIALLSENGLSIGAVTYVFNEDVKKNFVLSQYPDQGAAIQRGFGINVLVSLGKKQSEYLMPDLSGLTIDDAILRIEKNRLKVGEIKSVSSDTQPLNVITGHEPMAFSRVMEGSTVNLIINRKPGDGIARTYMGNEGARLFRYKVDNGFMKKHIRVQMSCYGSVNEVYNNFANPGEEIWVMVPVETSATVFVYDEDLLIKTQFFN